MPMIRRRLPSGLTQRIFAKLNFSTDCYCGMESGIAFRADLLATAENSGHALVGDVLASIELQRRSQSDSQGSSESRLSVLADSYSLNEARRTVSVDALGTAEYSAALLADCVGAGETRGLFASDRVAYAEAATTISYDRIALAEANLGVLAAAKCLSEDVISGVSADALPTLESLGTRAFDAVVRAESSARFTRSSIGWTENAALLNKDHFGAIEYLSQGVSNLGADALGTVESRGTQSVDALGRIESVALFSRDGVAWTEYVATVSKDQLSGLEYLGRIRSDLPAALESLARVLGDAAAVGEAAGSTVLVIDKTALIEFQARVRGDAGGQGENLATAIASGLSSDAFGAIELLASFIADGRAAAESRARPSADGLAGLENIRGVQLDSFPTQENRTGQQSDRIGLIEARIVGISDAAATAEFLARMAADGLAGAEHIRGLQADSLPTQESRAGLQGDVVGWIEGRGGGFVADLPAQLEALLHSGGDAISAVELARRVIGDVLGAVESRRLVLIDVSPPAVEFLGGGLGRTLGAFESVAKLLRVANASIEAQSLSIAHLADAQAAVEIAGITFLPTTPVTALSEFGQGGGGDATSQVESRGTLGIPFDPDGSVLIDGPYFVLDKTHTGISSSRIRIITVPYASLGIAVQPFDPLAVDTLDFFAFDFTLDAAGAVVTATTWTATFDPGSTTAVDDTPQARVITAWPAATLYTVNPFDNSLQAWNGAFSAAMIGTFPVSAAGGTYTLSAVVNLSDTRVLQITSTVLCVGHQR